MIAVDWNTMDAYVAINSDGSYDAFVKGKGFRAGDTLPACLRFIREVTGHRQGAVCCFDREADEWVSEFDLSSS